MTNYHKVYNQHQFHSMPSKQTVASLLKIQNLLISYQKLGNRVVLCLSTIDLYKKKVLMLLHQFHLQKTLNSLRQCWLARNVIRPQKLKPHLSLLKQHQKKQLLTILILLAKICQARTTKVSLLTVVLVLLKLLVKNSVMLLAQRMRLRHQQEQNVHVIIKTQLRQLLLVVLLVILGINNYLTLLLKRQTKQVAIHISLQVTQKARMILFLCLIKLKRGIYCIHNMLKTSVQLQWKADRFYKKSSTN